MAIDFKKLVKGLFIKDSSDPSKGFKLEIDPAAATNTTTTILAEQQANVTLSLPGETSELVGDVANQTLQNKTIDAANNNIVGLTDAEISATAAIDASKLADGSVSNVEFQYLGNVTSDIQTQLNTGATNLTNHLNDTTDAHDASAISNVPSGNLSATDQQSANNELQSDIDTRLLKAGDTMSGNLNMGSNLITALGTPVSGTDAANKNYVDGIAAGLDPKESVRVATTASVGGSYATTPSNGRFTGAATTIDGVALSTNDRVLIKDQADAKQNGIYVYDGAGQYTRSADMDGSPSSEVSGGNFVFVAQGTTNGASGFVLVASGIVTLNTDNLNFTQFSGGANSANKTLSNLDAPTSINQDLLPSSNNSKSIGSSSLNYQNAYITTLKDNAGVDSHAVSSRILKDSAGSNSIDYSNTSEVSFNSKKLNSLGSAAGLNYATTKQNVQEYIKNLIPDGDAEGANIISVYNDSSTTRPVDGTGGTQANLAATITSTNPLSGTNSFLLTKSGSASTQGSGFSIPFTIGSAYKAKVLQIEFDYIVNSGTFVAGSSTSESDVIVYIYDVTNSQLIEPSSIKFLSNSSTISDKFIANFQTSATGTSYRLILHCQSTSTANYELKLDNIAIQPCNYVYGTPITDWVAYTPSNTQGLGTITSVNLKWRRVGDSMEIQGGFATGTVTGSTAQLGLPSGSTIGGTTSSRMYAGETIRNGGSRVTNFAIQGATYLTFGAGAASHGDVIGSSLFGSSEQLYITAFDIPISGWSSSVQVSDGYDGRQIAAHAHKNASDQTGVNPNASFVKITFGSTASSGGGYDQTASFDTTNSKFTAPSSGKYSVKSNITLLATNILANEYGLVVYKNGSFYKVLDDRTQASTTVLNLQGSTTLDLVAGDYLELYLYGNGNNSASTLTIAGNVKNTWFAIEKLSSPQTMSATEVVAASYQMGTAQTLTSTGIIKFDTKLVDTHNAYNTTTGVFTAPVSGLYETGYQLLSITATANWQIALRKQSSTVVRASCQPMYNGGTSLVPNNSTNIQPPTIIWLDAGQTVDVYNTVAIGTGTLYASTADNYWYIKRIK